MNKNTIISFVIIIVVIVLGVIFYKYSSMKNTPESPIEALDKATQADTTDQIDASLNSIDVNSSTDADLKAIDDELNNL